MRTNEDPAAAAARLRTLARHISGSVAFIDPDVRYVFADGLSLADIGVTSTDLEGRTPYEVFEPEIAELLASHYRAALAGEEQEFTYTNSGRVRLVRVVPVAEEGRVVGAVTTSQDLTEHTRLITELREANERFRLLMEHAPIGMSVVALDGRFLDVNPSLCTMTGFSREELLGRTWQDITHPADLDADAAQVDRLVAGEIPSYSMEKRYYRRDGSILWVLISVSPLRDDDGNPAYALAQIVDITERKSRERALERRATEDVLTGVWNRRTFEEAVGTHAPAGSLLLLDVDDLKTVNDTAGHAAGDDRLRTVVRVLRGRLRRDDWIGRWGGDEFVVFLENVAADVAERIATELERVLDREQAPTSIGIAWTDGTVATEELVAAADERMYARKHLRVRAA